MKHSNIFWGTLLVSVGFLLLFDRLDMLSFDWWAFGKLWPFLIILWGVSILPVQGIIKIVLALVVAAGSIFMYSQNAEPREHRKNYSFHFDDEDEYNDTTTYRDERVDQSFNEPYNPEITKARLEMDAGAGSFVLQGSTGELIFAENKGFGNQFNFKVEAMEGEAKILVKQQSDIKLGKNQGNKFNLMLNTQPVWEFDFDIGAAEFDFDLTNHKVSKMDIDGGAASIELKIGELLPETDISIDAGASSIEIRIPAEAGCRILGTTVLSSRNLDGFDKIEKGHYETPNFASATQKIRIRVDAAVSSFSVIREE